MPTSRKRIKAALAVAAAVLLAPPAGADMLTRAGWGAKPALAGQQAHTVQRITLHHTAVRANPARPLAAKMRGLQRFSQSDELLADGRRKPVWPDVPYHFYIGAAGQVAEGRDLRFAGDTNTNYDPAGHISIALEGNFEVEKPTKAQEQALAELLARLMQDHGLTAADVGTHRHFTATACPGRHLEARLPAILNAAAR